MMMMDKEETTMTADIYFSVAGVECGVCVSRWYLIKNDTKPEAKEKPSPVFSDLQPNCAYNLHSTCVALDSVLYVIGGEDQRRYSLPSLEFLNFNNDDDYCMLTDEVYCINTLYPEKGWTKCPSMSRTRCRAQAFTLESKIYVLGGFILPELDDNDYNDFALVYDPSSSSCSYWQQAFSTADKSPSSCSYWQQAFSNISDNFNLLNLDANEIKVTTTSGGARVEELFVHAVGFDNERLLFKYTFKDKLWELVAKDFGPRLCKCRLLIDGILYTYGNYPMRDQEKTERGSIFCYDVNKPHAKPKILRHLEKYLPRFTDFYPRSTLLHLGGGTKFCLLWSSFEDDDGTITGWNEEEHCPKDDDITGPNEEEHCPDDDDITGLNEEEHCPDDDDITGPNDPLFIFCLKFTVSKEHKLSPSGEEEVEFFASDPSRSCYYVDGLHLLNAIAIPSFRGQRGST